MDSILYINLWQETDRLLRACWHAGNGAPVPGILIRESLSPGAIQAAISEYPSQSGFYNRQTTGGSSASQVGSFTAYPNWMKLTRVGNSFSAYVASDGVNWTQIGAPVTIAMATNAYIGIAMF